MAMTEAQAISQIESDGSEATDMAASVTTAYNSMDDAAVLLTATVAALDSKLATLESNVRYAMEKYL